VLLHASAAAPNVTVVYSSVLFQRHGETVRAIRAACELRPEVHVAIMLDTKGPEIRTGLLKDHKPVTFVENQDLFISTDYTLEGDATRISCSYPSLPTSVKVGGAILIADGTVVAEVKELRADGVLVRVLNSATIGEKKNMASAAPRLLSFVCVLKG